MRPEARIGAAIEILDSILEGAPAEQRLTTWARGNRYAGSSDRAAIRDIVFDALRRCRSYGWLGGSVTGRGLMIGALRAACHDPRETFTGLGHAPAALTESERVVSAPLHEAPPAVRCDCPDWLWPELVQGHGDNTEELTTRLRDRAPVFLRVNFSKGTREVVAEALCREGIETRPHPLAPTALEVLKNARRVRATQTFAAGRVELQDAASQAVVLACLDAVTSKNAVLDYCAGGGGKALAFAAKGVRRVVAHDADRKRMDDIPARADRAGTPIERVAQVRGVFDLVLCDAPCSGSGAWRRQPQGKWGLTPERLAELTTIQDEILATAQHFVGAGGLLAYATCSLLPRENSERVEAFLSRFQGWRLRSQKQWTPLEGGDGFFLSIFQRN